MSNHVSIWQHASSVITTMMHELRKVRKQDIEDIYDYILYEVPVSQVIGFLGAISSIDGDSMTLPLAIVDNPTYLQPLIDVKYMVILSNIGYRAGYIHWFPIQNDEVEDGFEAERITENILSLEQANRYRKNLSVYLEAYYAYQTDTSMVSEMRSNMSKCLKVPYTHWLHL